MEGKTDLLKVGQDMTLTELFKDIKDEVIRDNIVVEGDVCKVSSKKEIDYYCEDCNKKLIIKNGKNGKFWGCSGYRNCPGKKTKDIDELPEYRVFVDLISSYDETSTTMLNVIVYIKHDEELQIPNDSKVRVTGQLKVYKGKLQFHCSSAKNIEVIDEENSYTRKKNEWQERIDDIKVKKKKKRTFAPSDDMYVAVISTDEKDQGYNDFVGKFNGNVFTCAPYCISPMTADNVVKKLKEIPIDEFDCIAIVRGGGDYNYSLFDFNNPILAEAINDIDIPVIVGIGHKDDKFLIDKFSYREAITPTDAAAKIKSMFYENSPRNGNYKEELQEELQEKEQRIKDLEEELARVKGSKVFKLFDFLRRLLR